jgi:ribosomal protein S18 acetylase RimI-like enzyme
MYVKPEYRGEEFNKIITDELINWARSRNIQEIRLDVYAENESAIKHTKKQVLNLIFLP